MQRGDWHRFKARLDAMVQVLKGRRLSQDGIEGYWRALRDLGIEEVERACARAEQELVWVPAPKELRVLAGKARTDNPRPTPKDGHGLRPQASPPPPTDPAWDVSRRRAREMVEALTRKEAKRIADEEDLI